MTVCDEAGSPGAELSSDPDNSTLNIHNSQLTEAWPVASAYWGLQ